MAFAIISDAKSMIWQVIFFENHLYFIAIISVKMIHHFDKADKIGL